MASYDALLHVLPLPPGLLDGPDDRGLSGRQTLQRQLPGVRSGAVPYVRRQLQTRDLTAARAASSGKPEYHGRRGRRHQHSGEDHHYLGQDHRYLE